MAKLQRDATKRGRLVRAREGGYADPGDHGPANVRVTKNGRIGSAGTGRCFACDGSGQTCNACGEAEGVCACAPDEKDVVDCDACKGSGR